MLSRCFCPGQWTGSEEGSCAGHRGMSEFVRIPESVVGWIVAVENPFHTNSLHLFVTLETPYKSYVRHVRFFSPTDLGWSCHIPLRSTRSHGCVCTKARATDKWTIAAAHPVIVSKAHGWLFDWFWAKVGLNTVRTLTISKKTSSKSLLFRGLSSNPWA